MLVSVVVPTRNRQTKLRRCIDSVTASDWKEIEIIVIDDHSDYDVASQLADVANVRVLRNPARMLLSFSRNAGARVARGEFVFFLDDDNIIAPDAIGQLVQVLQAEGSTAVCSPLICLYGAPSRVWTSTIKKGRFPGSFVLSLAEPPAVVPTFSFHDAFMVKRSVFEGLGMFDAENFPVHFSELDFAYRLSLSGYAAKVNPRAKVWHDVVEGHMHVDSERSFYTIRNRILLLRRYEPDELDIYLLIFLVPLTIYYLFHHVRNTRDNRLATALNLLKGVSEGISHPIQQYHPSRSADPNSETSSSTSILVSVVVPSRNSETTLGACLDSLTRQSYKNIEVIVVDNYSTDSTQRIARSFSAKLIVAGHERSEQTNIGVMESKGSYVWRTDADFVFDRGLVSQAVAMAERGYDAIVVNGTSRGGGLWARVRRAERESLFGDWAHTAASFFSKKAFLKAGGYDEKLYAMEDYDLHNRLLAAGFRVGRIQAKAYHLGEPRHLSEVVSKYRRYGDAANLHEFLKRNPGKGMWQIAPLRLVYVRNIRKFGLLFFPFLLYYFVKYVSASIGYLETRL